MPVKWFGDEVEREAIAAAEKGLSKLAGMIAQESRQSLENVGRGRDYSQGGKSKRFKHRSSAPFDPPSAQHGTQGLQGAIVFEQPSPLLRHIGWAADYQTKSGKSIGWILEIGSRNMESRPHLRPALYKYTGRTGEELFEGLLK